MPIEDNVLTVSAAAPTIAAVQPKLSLSPNPSPIIREAINRLKANTSIIKRPEINSHTTYVITGLEQPSTIEDLGIYLAALTYQLIREDLRLLRVIPHIVEDASIADRKLLMLETIRSTVKKAKEDLDRFRDYERNPWIGEGVSHLIGYMEAVNAVFFKNNVIAVSQVHANAKDNGLDLVVLLKNGDKYSYGIGETKVSKDNMGSNLYKAITLYTEVDAVALSRETNLRQVLLMLSRHLPEDHGDFILTGSGHKQRSYHPFAFYSSSSGFCPWNEHEKMKTLDREPDDIRLAAFPLDDFYGFFDKLVISMESACDKLFG